jgi:hypothetical protein
VHELAHSRQVIILSRDQRLKKWGAVVPLQAAMAETDYAGM